MATASEDCDYYSKVNQLQEFLSEKETKRRELHHQYNKYMKSDKKRSLSQAAQLQAYWKKLCENEKASHARNQRLLKEFDRVEAHVTSLSLRTERLRRVQEQYKRQVDQKYPNWRQRYIEQLIRKRKQPNPSKPTPHIGHAEESFVPRRGQQMYHQGYPQHDGAPVDSRPYGHGSSSATSPTRDVTPEDEAYHRPDEITVRHRLPEADITADATQLPSPTSPTRDVTPEANHRSGDTTRGHPLQDTAAGRRSPHDTPFDGNRGDSTPTRIPAADHPGHTRKGSGTFIVTSQEGLTRDMPLEERREDPQPSMAPIQRGAVAHRQIFGGSPTPGSKTNFGEVGDVSSRTDPFSSSSGEEDSQEEEMGDSLVGNGISNIHTGKTGSQVESGTHDSSSNRSVVPSPEKVDAEMGHRDEGRLGTDAPATLNGLQDSEQDQIVATGDRGSPLPSDGSDIDSDLSLPLSENNRHSSPEQKPASPQGPQLTINGYIHLLQGLEYLLERHDGHIDLYDEGRCSPEKTTSVTKDANSKLPMDTYDLLSLSRVVLQELPLLVQVSPRGYLISDQVLRSDRPILEVTIRSAITTNALPFWDRTLKHMVFLIRRGYYEPDEIALRVAPLMLAEDSMMAERAVQVVTSLLEDAVEEPTLEESSLTQTSMEETPSAPRQESKTGGNSVPPLKLDMSGDVEESSEDSFFDQAVPLKETDAYKQMLQSVQPKSGRQTDGRLSATDKDAEGLLAELGDTSSDDDDIDAMLSPSATGRSSPAKPRQNTMSPPPSVTPDKVDHPLGSPKGEAIPAEKGPSKDEPSPDKSDVVSSSSEALQGRSGGYIPSAIDNSLKSSGRQSNALQRSSSFWGEDSDLDSEMSVPMGAGGVEEDKDDFDFYD